MADADRIYALYEDMETAATAVNTIIMKGVVAENVSLVTYDPDEEYARYIDADVDDVSGSDGAGFGAIVGTLTGLSVALIPGFGPIFAAGPFAAALMAGIGAGAGAATGGLTAALIEFGVDEDDVEHYNRTLKEGGALAIVDPVDDEQEDMVKAIFKSHSPIALED